jgi:hypothetical protein
MAGQRVTFHLEAGTTFTRTLEYTNPDGSLFDLTGFSALLQLRETPTSPLALEIVPTLDVAASTIEFTITAAQSSALTLPRYAYAIELTAPDGTVSRLLQGSFKVSPEVVREEPQPVEPEETEGEG